MSKELWRPISEFPNYSVSTLGRVKRVHPHSLPNGGFAPLKILKPQIDINGYPRVLLSNKPKTKKRKFALIHRFELIAFKGLPHPKLQVNHKNGIKTDNKLENLEWVTPSENQLHSYRNGLQIPLRGKYHWMKKHPDRIPRGSKQGNSKLTESDVIRIRSMRSSGDTLFKIADEFGVCFQLISLIYRRKLWKHI